MKGITKHIKAIEENIINQQYKQNTSKQNIRNKQH